MIRSLLRDTGAGFRPRDRQVFEAWTAALEPGLVSRAVPVRFRRGELLVEVATASYLQELKNFTGETYRRRANARLGGDTVKKVVFKPRGLG